MGFLKSEICTSRVSPLSSYFFCPGPSVCFPVDDPQVLMMETSWQSSTNPEDGARFGYFSQRATALGAETGVAPLPTAQSQRGVSILFFFLHPTSAFIAEVFMNSVHEFMNRYGVSASLPFLPRKQHVKTWDILFHHSPAPSSGIPSAYRIKC